MKKFLVILILFLLTLVTVYDYFYFQKNTTFIPLTNTLNIKDGTRATFDTNSFPFTFTDESIIETIFINEEGNLVIITKNEDETMATFHFYEFYLDYTLVNQFDFFIVKPDPTYLLFPEKETKILSIEQISHNTYDTYMILLNRSIFSLDTSPYSMKNSPAYPNFWIFSANKVQDSITYYYEVKNGPEVYMYKNSINGSGLNLATPIIPIDNIQLLSDGTLIHWEGSIITKYSADGQLLWTKKYLEFENNVQFNQVIELNDGNIALIGSYHDTVGHSVYHLFQKATTIQSLRDGLIVKLSGDKGDVLWDKVFNGYEQDAMDFISGTCDQEGEFHLFGYYGIATPTLFFSVHLDLNGVLLNDQVFEFIQPAGIQTSEISINPPTYVSPFHSLYIDDPTLYKNDRVIIGGAGSDQILYMDYLVSNYSHEITPLSTQFIHYHNYLVIVDMSVCGLIGLYGFYKIFRLFDHKKRKTRP